MKKLIIAEKPSVARNIADALKVKGRSDGYIEGESHIITWVFGHLLQLYDAKDYDERMRSWRLENFPFIPKSFEYKIKRDSRNKNAADKGAEKQIQILKSLVERDDVDCIISATDYDREGQVIADEIFLYLNVEKPVKRLLLNEWTSDEVLKGLEKLKTNEEMKPLQDAGMGRQLADWLIGINLTSVATVKHREDESIGLLNVGRVLLPTLKIIYDRDKEIESFQSSKYYKLIGEFTHGENSIFEGLYYENDSEKFEKKEVLEGIQKEIEGKNAYVAEKQVEQKKEYPPYLFNLSSLQGYITGKYKGWTADKVLSVAQDLYEKKFITYPRTASSVLEESLKDKAQKVLSVLKKGLPYEDQIKFSDSKRIFDNSKVESHSAIIPTYVVPKSLSDDERKIYSAVKDRFIMQFMPVALAEETRLELKVNDCDISGVFQAKGRVQIEEGWRIVEEIDTKETILPFLEKGQQVPIYSAKISEVIRKPPRPHTEKSLLRVMETCGRKYEKEDSDEMMMAILSGFSIGTPATRGETIKKLKTTGYIRSKGKNLVCTDLGKKMVETFPVKDLFDLEYTGRLEKTLADIERRKFSKEDFLQMIVEFTEKSVEEIKNDVSFGAKIILPEGVESLGICPECGNHVVETSKSFGCTNWKNGCKYAIWKEDKYIESFGKKVSPEMVRLLLKNGKVGFRNLQSKKGKRFSAYFYYKKDESTGKYRWQLEFI